PRGGAPERVGGEPRRDRSRPLLRRRPDPERRRRRPGRPHHVRADCEDEPISSGAGLERPGRHGPAPFGGSSLAAGLERDPARAEPRASRPLLAKVGSSPLSPPPPPPRGGGRGAVGLPPRGGRASALPPRPP